MHINALAMNRIDSLIIIGVPGEELGYNEGSKKRLKGYYANMPANFILAGITKVSKASGQRQSLLFKWLTDRRKNGLFDIDAKEAGEKFFINKYGRLYAVMGPRVSLSSPIMSRILSERGH